MLGFKEMTRCKIENVKMECMTKQKDRKQTK